MRKSFGELFKDFRLKSGFSSVSKFCEALAKEGYFYEESLFFHWQNNTRIPKDRNFLYTIMLVLVKNGGITSLTDVNGLFESANQGYITKLEEKFLWPHMYAQQLKFARSLTEVIDHKSYKELMFSTDNKDEVFEQLERQTQQLYVLMYKGDPFTAVRRLKKLEVLVEAFPWRDIAQRFNLLNKIRWVYLRCLSDIYKPGQFETGITCAKTHLLFALEKSHVDIGSLYWTNAALLRLQILPIETNNIPKQLTSSCLSMLETSLRFTSKSNFPQLLVEHLEMAKLALLIGDKNIFTCSINKALSLMEFLDSNSKHMAVMVWDVKSRGTIRFEHNIDKALGEIETAKIYATEDYQAINLYLGATEIQALQLSHDSLLRERAASKQEKIAILAHILENPYQQERLNVTNKLAGL